MKRMATTCVVVMAAMSCAGRSMAQWACPAPEWTATMSAANSGSGARVVTLGNGDVVMGGQFVGIDGVTMNNIARWDGGGWHALGTGLNGKVDSLAVAAGDEVIVGGAFTQAGGKSALHVARWDGNEWWPMGTGLDGLVWCVAELQGGEVMAGGLMAGGTKSVVVWDGVSWNEAGTSTNGVVRALLQLPNGDVIVAGEFTLAGGVGVSNLARWDGTGWSTVGGGVFGGPNDGAWALAHAPNGDLVVAGRFTTAGSTPASSIARWDGANWSALGAGLTTSPFWVEAVAALANGDVVAGGSFMQAGGQPIKYLARWDGAAWMPIGDAPAGFVAGLAKRGESLVAAGSFSSIGGVPTAMMGVYGCPPICQVDCDLSGSGTIDDFICFQTLFALGDLGADCDASGVLDLDDFICFQTEFALGC